MKKGVLQFLCVGIFILLISTSACVAPPKPGTSASPGAAGAVTPTTEGAKETPVYVTIETPYSTGIANPTKKITTAEPTPPPEEWVEINHISQPFGFNATAFSFNLQNPPMIIFINVKPVNQTRTKEITNPFGSREDITITIDDYSPASWFELTVRNKNNGQILQQAGFGNTYSGKLYSQELNQTIKVLQKGDMLVELNGNLITAHVNVSVKKEGNIVNITPG